MTSLFLNQSSWVLVYVALMFALVWMWYARRVLPYWAGRKPFSQGNYDEALRRLAWLERLHLKTATLLHFKGTILMFAGRNEEAEQVLKECLARQQFPIQKSLALVNLGYVYLAGKRFDEARQTYEEAIQLRPDGAVAYSSLAEVHLQQGIDARKALELVDRGIKLKQSSEMQAGVDQHIFGYLFANRAWALYLMDRPAEAEAALEEARKFAGVEVKAGAAGVHYHMARALVAGGLDTAAREHFRQAREIDPKGMYAALAEAALRGH